VQILAAHLQEADPTMYEIVEKVRDPGPALSRHPIQRAAF
jgi:hypothetical protein